MSASKLFLCRTVLSSNLALISASKWTPKPFSTLSCITRHVTPKHNTVPSLNILSKPRIKIEFVNRNTGTTTATTTTPTRATAMIEKSAGSMQKKVGYWLLGCSALVYGTILAGGYTRLTESGLSMVTWKFAFESYPKTEEEWLKEFEKYQEYPEFKLLKKDITLEEFKTIWKTEYYHRNMGRTVGLAFMVPAVIFWLLGCFKPRMKKRILYMGTLIVSQGLLGWYMVKSGLEDRFHKETDVPRVSQYRLAGHLGLALVLYTALLMSGMDLLLLHPKVVEVSAGVRRVRMLALSCKGLIFLTALSGALVAGLDAGLVYNSFPKMGDSWIPNDILALSPVLKNFTENPTTVQFDHRILGLTTFSAIMATWLISKRHVLPKRARLAVNVLALGALAQVALGVSTLVHYVPTPLAVSHQTGSVALLSLAIWLAHELKILKYVPK